MKYNSKYTMDPEPFFKKMLKDPVVKKRAEMLRERSELAMALLTVRKKAKLTQAQVAKKMGTTQSVIAKYETGQGEDNPTYNFLDRFAKACGKQLNPINMFQETLHS